MLEEHNLLDLLLSELLVDHFLLGREVILFNLLTTSFDIKLTIVLLIFIIFVHDFTILVLLHLLGSLHHEELLLLLFSEVIDVDFLLVVIILAIIFIAILIVTLIIFFSIFLLTLV